MFLSETDDSSKIPDSQSFDVNMRHYFFLNIHNNNFKDTFI